MNWYYEENGKQLGPFSEIDFQASVRSGAVTEETLVWREGLPQWTKYGEVLKGGDAGVLVAETTCVECNRAFPEEEMANFGGNLVCARCKPAFVQKVKEGLRVGGDMAYVGFWKRFGAKTVDSLLVQAINFGLGFAILAIVANKNVGEIINIFVGFALGTAGTIFLLGKYGATPGKMLLKAKVVRSDGSPLTYGRATGRFFAEWVSGMTFGIGYLMACWDKEKRTLHDRIADTRVVLRR